RMRALPLVERIVSFLELLIVHLPIAGFERGEIGGGRIPREDARSDAQNDRPRHWKCESHPRYQGLHISGAKHLRSQTSPTLKMKMRLDDARLRASRTEDVIIRCGNRKTC